jgi:hypothetical protein
VHVYDDADYDETLEQVESVAPYALTGAVFAQDPRRDRARAARCARGRQLLRQRQADRRGRRPAAVRRRARLGHQRQGGRGDTVPVPLTQTTTEQGTLLWDPGVGLVERRREILIETSIPAAGRIRTPVRSRVVQHVTLTRLPPAACS